MSFDRCRRIADAVLYEGYVLYPYRASAVKNRMRFPFGVAMPPGFTAGGERSVLAAELPIEGVTPRIDLALRFLGLTRRADPSSATGTWDEGEPREIEVRDVALVELANGGFTLPFSFPGETVAEGRPVCEGGARVARTSEPLEGCLTVSVLPVGSGHWRLRLAVTNRSGWMPPSDTTREDALLRALVGVHVLIEVREGALVSTTDPGPAARAIARDCEQDGLWPILLGAPGERRFALASPILLGDHPQIAEESPADLCDSTEIDEILLLRTLTLTDAEKAEARRTDPRAARIIAHAESLDPHGWLRLHGAVRDWPDGVRAEDTDAHDMTALLAADVPPEAEEVTVGGVRLTRGARVRLRPSRSADAMDLFLDGREARVARVHKDIDGATHVAVTLGIDGADLLAAVDRYYYFHPEEIEPLPDGEERVSLRAAVKETA